MTGFGWIESLVILGAVLLAALFLLRRAARTLKGESEGCGSCPSSGAPDGRENPRLPTLRKRP